LLLNRIALAPGEGIFLPAGNLHSYLHGIGMEVMANSDNVLRGGLTPKHVDVPELLRVLDFTPVQDARVGTYRDGVETVYQTPAPEFAASVLNLDGADLGHRVDAQPRHDGPQILVCIDGSVVVRSTSGEVRIDRGMAAWVAAFDGPIRVEASVPSRLFRATVGI
jgi:mannose-6-phosphate isomerase